MSRPRTFWPFQKHWPSILHVGPSIRHAECSWMAISSLKMSGAKFSGFWKCRSQSQIPISESSSKEQTALANGVLSWTCLGIHPRQPPHPTHLWDKWWTGECPSLPMATTSLAQKLLPHHSIKWEKIIYKKNMWSYNLTQISQRLWP